MYENRTVIQSRDFFCSLPLKLKAAERTYLPFILNEPMPAFSVLARLTFFTFDATVSGELREMALK